MCRYVNVSINMNKILKKSYISWSRKKRIFKEFSRNSRSSTNPGITYLRFYAIKKCHHRFTVKTPMKCYEFFADF